MMMKHKCPHCNVELKIDDVIDIDVDEDYVNCKVIGYCPECDRLYSWYNHYKYEKSSDFGLTF
jgi:transcription elongation factor Elf1